MTTTKAYGDSDSEEEAVAYLGYIYRIKANIVEILHPTRCRSSSVSAGWEYRWVGRQ